MSHGWSTVAPETDVDASWSSWTDAARSADEHALAVSLHVRGARQDPVPLGETVAHAADLLLAGHVAEARRALDATTLGPPDDSAPHGGHLVLAAVHAAGGDDQAWRWLLSTAGRTGPTLLVSSLVGAAADARGDVLSADAAWAEVASFGPSSATGVVRAAVATIARRPRELSVPLSEIVGTWAGAAVALDPQGSPAASLAIADGLVARGDHAGARLLLRATSMLTADTSTVRGRLRALRPADSRRDAAVAVAVFVALVAAGVVQVTQTGQSVLPPFVIAFGAWLRYRPVGGMTRAESGVWHGMRGWTYDTGTGQPTHGRPFVSLFLGAGVLAGAGAWGLLVLGVPALAGVVGVDGAPWRAPVSVALTASVAAAVGGVVAARAVVRRVTAARARRHRSSAAARLRADASVCRCWAETWWRGDLASAYASHHLAGTGLADPVPGGSVRHCPETGVLWLTGALAASGLPIALRGQVPQVAVADHGRPEAGTGFYL